MQRLILFLVLLGGLSCSKDQPPTAPAGKKNCDFCDLFDSFQDQSDGDTASDSTAASSSDSTAASSSDSTAASSSDSTAASSSDSTAASSPDSSSSSGSVSSPTAAVVIPDAALTKIHREGAKEASWGDDGGHASGNE